MCYLSLCLRSQGIGVRSPLLQAGAAQIAPRQSSTQPWHTATGVLSLLFLGVGLLLGSTHLLIQAQKGLEVFSPAPTTHLFKQLGAGHDCLTPILEVLHLERERPVQVWSRPLYACVLLLWTNLAYLPPPLSSVEMSRTWPKVGNIYPWANSYIWKEDQRSFLNLVLWAG